MLTAPPRRVPPALGFTPLSEPNRWMELDRRPVTPVTGQDQQPGQTLTVEA